MENLSHDQKIQVINNWTGQRVQILTKTMAYDGYVLDSIRIVYAPFDHDPPVSVILKTIFGDEAHTIPLDEITAIRGSLLPDPDVLHSHL